MFKDNIKVTGELHVVLRDQYGHIKHDQLIPNLVVTSGKVVIARLLAGLGGVMTHMGVGAGAIAAGSADTALGAELTATNRPTVTTAVSINTVTYIGMFGPGVGTGPITEAAIFNAATAGTMLCRTTFGVVTKAAADTLTINWVVSIN